jgi:hypothetical protein
VGNFNVILMSILAGLRKPNFLYGKHHNSIVNLVFFVHVPQLYGPMASFCEHDIEPFSFTKGRECQRDCNLLINDYAT